MARAGWGDAIVEAERQIQESERKIHRLRVSIQTFKEMETKKEPFPGVEPLLGQDSDL